jgi:hypothetical protein
MEGKENKASGYSYTRNWFDFTIENPDKIAPVHTALYLWAVELNNKLGWKEKFGLPTDYSMQAIGLRNRRTYYKALNDLINFGFIEMVTKSTNQHTSNIIALSSACVKNAQASHKHIHKQVTGTAPIDKQYKQEETLTNNLNPKGDANFFNDVISIFKKAYEEINKIPYVITSEQKEISAAGRFIEIYKEATSVNDEGELLTQLEPYFKACCSINDEWLHSRMDLTILADKFNIINNSIKNGKGKGVTYGELEAIAKKFGSDSPSGITHYPTTQPDFSIPQPPTLKEFIQYFEENGYKDIAEKAFTVCSNACWRDQKNNSFIDKWKIVVKNKYFK